MLVLIMIEDMLSDHGCEDVTAAATVNQALALINTQIFDAAMLDLNLNGTPTYCVADALAARGTPFLFSTGYSGDGVRDGYRDRPILKKPFMDQEMAAMLMGILDATERLHLVTRKEPGGEPGA